MDRAGSSEHTLANVLLLPPQTHTIEGSEEPFVETKRLEVYFILAHDIVLE